MGNVHIFDFYRDALGAIREEGLLRFLRRVATPYVVASGAAFRSARERRTPSASCAGWTRAAVTGGHDTTHNVEIRRKSEANAAQWVRGSGYGWDRRRDRMGTSWTLAVTDH